MKRIFGFLLAVSAFFVLISCGQRVDWTDSNGYNDATYLESTYKEDSQKLEINVDNSSGYLNNITKDYIIVKARNYDSSNESKELTSSLLPVRMPQAA